MDDAWRFHPPPSSFDEHFRFHAPFPSLPPPPPPPPYHNPGIRGPNPWAMAPVPLDWPTCTTPAPHPPQSFFDEERESCRKRMRIDDPAQTFHPLANRILFEDERRLNLIRDHGIEYHPGVHGSGSGFGSRNGHLSYPEHSFGHQSYPVRANEFEGFPDYQAVQSSQRFEGSSQLNHLSRHHVSLPPVAYVPQEHQQLHLDKNPYFSPTQSRYTHNDDQNRFRYHNQQAEMAMNHHEYQHPNPEGVHRIVEYQSCSLAQQYGSQGVNKETFSTFPSENGENCNMAKTVVNHSRTQQLIPPLPSQPLPSAQQKLSPPSLQDPSPLPQLTAPSPVPYPVMASNAPNKPLLHAARVFPDSHLSSGFYSEPSLQSTATFATKALPVHQTPLTLYAEEQGPSYPSKHLKEEKPTVVDACHLFRQPHRVSRPDHFVIILRGLPGSGKSYLAKALRDIEVENGGSAPRIHAMDDYFMVEVEKKVEENGGSRSSSSIRGKKQVTKKVIEYCYEPEMEEAYRSSMLKAFKKTLDEGIFTFIIVDDRNLRVADFAQFWAIAKKSHNSEPKGGSMHYSIQKRSGYEVYLLEATYKDPAGCAVRNIHGFTLDDIKKMADQWEDTSSLYLQLDVQSLFHGDDLRDCSIQEVDMDMDDGAGDTDGTHGLKDREGIDITEPITSDHAPDGLEKVQEGCDDEKDEAEPTSVTELEKSKWSRDLYDDFNDSVSPKYNSNALSGLLQTYGKGDKSVRWGDQIDQSGFSISAVKRRRSISSLIIGPGSGYNLKSNPLQEQDSAESSGKGNASESKKRFHEQLRAERESFKAVFDRRKQRIGGLHDAEDA